MICRPWFVLTVSISLLLGGGGSARAAWHEASPGIWSGQSAGWSFTVNAARARLVGARAGGEANILLAGGHRAWLGPQIEWPEFWPPPVEWEDAPAETVAISPDGAELVLTMPRPDLAYPRLIKRYRLTPRGLQCGLEWADYGEGRHLAIHILQLRPDALARITILPTATAPLGFAHAPTGVRDRFDPTLPWPWPGETADQRLPRYDGVEHKIAVAPQPIAVEWPTAGSRFTMHRGVQQGEPAADAELGLLTQIYIGAEGWPMVEVEQLSPRLRGNPARPTVAFWIELCVASDQP